MKSKGTFSREYKLAAVKKIVEQDMSYAEVAKDLGVSDGLLRNWRKKFEAEGLFNAAPACGLRTYTAQLPDGTHETARTFQYPRT